MPPSSASQLDASCPRPFLGVLHQRRGVYGAEARSRRLEVSSHARLVSSSFAALGHHQVRPGQLRPCSDLGEDLRLSVTVAARPAFLSSVPVKRFSIPVSIGPQATMLTRTPEEAASSAADLVSPSTACLLGAYLDASAAPVWP